MRDKRIPECQTAGKTGFPKRKPKAAYLLTGLLLFTVCGQTLFLPGCSQNSQSQPAATSEQPAAASGQPAAASEQTAAASGQSETEPEQTETVSYTDSVGRTVEVPKNAERIAALDSFSGEVMVLIGAGEKMVSCPNGTKSDVLLQEVYPGLSDITVVQSGGSIQEEELLKLEPDVLLVQDNFYESGEELAKIDALEIPYLVVKYDDMQGQIDALRMIGDVAGGEADTKSDAIADYYEETIDRVRAIAETIPQEECLTVYHSTNGTYQTDAKGSFGEDWISAVGAIDISAASDTDTVVSENSINEEQLYVWNPQVVVAQEKMTAEYFLEDPGFSGLEAVKNGRVYNLPVGATRWGKEGSAETFFALLWLGSTIYPDYYTEIDVKQEVTDFYRDYLGLTVDEELYETILSGEGLRKSSSGGN